MKRKYFIISLLILVTLPLSVEGFVFDSLNFWQKQPEESIAKLNSHEKQIAETKYNNWEEAYKDKIELLFGDRSNFHFSEGELNYILKKKIENVDAPIKDLKIYLKEGFIKAEAKLTWFIKGSIQLDVIPDVDKEEISLNISNVKLSGFWIPSWVPKLILKNNLNSEEFFNFLESYSKYKGVEVEIIENELHINYK